MRLFIGIPLPAEVTTQLSAIIMKLSSRDDGLRWSEPESWHITLQFLGNAFQEQYGCVVAGLGELHLPAVSITFESFGFFERAGIFYLGVRNTPALLEIQQSITAATAACGFVAEGRPYQPHITLARSKGKQGVHALNRLKRHIPGAPRLSSFRADAFLLYESFTESSGSRYEVRERFVFSDFEA